MQSPCPHHNHLSEASALQSCRRSVFARRVVPVILALLSLVTWVGCDDGGAAKKPTKPQQEANNQDAFELPPDDGISPEQILTLAKSRYARATSYSDRAVLYLSYRMDGRALQEPQPWSTSWDKTGRFGADLFNTQIRCDGQRLSCYVYDIDSGNLDGQRMIVPCGNRIPVDAVYSDSIAQHFVAGFSEMPLDESNPLAPKLIPPPISLLVGRDTGRLQNPWLQNHQRMQRMADATIDDRLCHVVRITDGQTTADMWVDAENGTIWQMSLPLKLLNEKVTNSSSITDLMLVARFHDAKFDQQLEDERVSLKSRPNSTPVRKFVTLPESFPSDLIGKRAPKFQLFKRNGQPVDQLTFDGKTTTLVWVVGPSSLNAIKKLDKISKQIAGANKEIAVVYSESELLAPQSGSLELQPPFARAAANSDLQFLFDQGLLASSQFKIRAIPAAVVIDGDSKVQFARALTDESWDRDLVAAVQRVEQGENVAAEMKSDYQRFLESYHQQLVSLSAADLTKDLEQKTPVSTASTGGNNASPATAKRLKSQLAWSNDRFKMAGNVTIAQDGQTIFVFDGWRTLVQLDSNGQPVLRKELDLPPDEAVNQLRTITDQAGKDWHALFDRGGDSVFVFDANWKPIARYPASDISHKGIRDCHFAVVGGRSVLLVAFDDPEQGIQSVDLLSGKGKPYSESICQSISVRGNQIAGIAENQVGNFSRTGVFAVAGVGDWQFNQIAHSQSGRSRQMVATGFTSSGDWNLVGLDSKFAYQWSVAIGDQFFDHQIQPISTAEVGGHSVWAVANAAGKINLISNRGEWLGEFNAGTRLRGFALTAIDGAPRLIVAGGNQIQAFDLQFVRNPMRRASNQK